MRVVLPREADAAVHLHAVLRVLEGGVERERERGRRRERDGVAVVDGARRVPGRGARELDPAEHVGALVLHALELTDGSAELDALLGVRGSRVDAPLRDAHELGGEQRGRGIGDARRRRRRRARARRRRRASTSTSRDAAREVDARQLA